jgi:hypothetical protein
LNQSAKTFCRLGRMTIREKLACIWYHTWLQNSQLVRRWNIVSSTWSHSGQMGRQAGSAEHAIRDDQQSSNDSSLEATQRSYTSKAAHRLQIVSTAVTWPCLQTERSMLISPCVAWHWRPPNDLILFLGQQNLGVDDRN